MEAITAGRALEANRDIPRVRQAFATLARVRRSWPSPADFLEAMPPPPVLKALPAKVSSPASAAAVMAEIERLFARH